MRKRCASPMGLAVLYSLCAVIWSCLALTRWRESPLYIAAGAVWLAAAAIQWGRVYRTKKKEEVEHE